MQTLWISIVYNARIHEIDKRNRHLLLTNYYIKDQTLYSCCNDYYLTLKNGSSPVVSNRGDS